MRICTGKLGKKTFLLLAGYYCYTTLRQKGCKSCQQEKTTESIYFFKKVYWGPLGWSITMRRLIGEKTTIARNSKDKMLRMRKREALHQS